MKIGFEHLVQMDRGIVGSNNKTYIESFEELCTHVGEGKIVYFSKDNQYGTIEMSEEAKVLITVATEREIDRIEGTTRKLQNVYFYLKETLFLMNCENV